MLLSEFFAELVRTGTIRATTAAAAIPATYPIDLYLGFALSNCVFLL